jgi:acyl-CoA synthetase (AMP-forming)/AMP-acid ligase II
MRKVSGRTDDMLIIRGVNVFPSQIESDLMEVFRQLTRLKLDSVEWLVQEDMPTDAPLLVDNKH